MNTELARRLWQVVLAVVGLLALNAAMAADAPENFQVVDGVAIYLGVMPAQIVQGHPKEHEENRMHGGVPRGSYRDHVVVALFDQASGRRIEDAQVTATVNELGRGGEWRSLEPMRIANTITYGNYFELSGNDLYHIRLRIRLSDRAKPIEATFIHRHFAP